MLMFLIINAIAIATAQQCSLTPAQISAQGNCPSDPNAATCLNDIVGSTSCTAKDSPIGKVVACVGSVCDGSASQTCVVGQLTPITLNLTIQANANRYDVGAYIAPSQTQAKNGYCCRYILSPLAATAASTNPQSGCGPYRNLDNDACGDIEANVVTYELITLNLLCQPDSNNKLVASFCTTWDNQASSNCNSYLDLRPGTGSKCKCAQIAIGNVDVIQSALTISIESDSSKCYTTGGYVTYRYRVTNPTAIALSDVVVTDSLGTSISCCADINSTVCPSGFTLSNQIPVLQGYDWRICQSASLGTSSSNTAYANGLDTRFTPPATQTATSSPVTMAFADLTITQAVTNNGDWNIVITNTGTSTLTNFNLVSSNIVYSSCVGPSTTIGPGASFPCAASVPPSGLVCSASNIVTVTAVSAQGCSPSATDSDSINYSRVCRAATNICDVAESCAAGSCPINGFAPDTVVCRAATTQCDANETCTGISDVCPPNVYQPLGTFCGNPPVGTCDQQDTCDGNNNCIDRYGSCNDGYSCTTDICDPSPPHNCQFTPDDQVCSDGVQCTRDVCVASIASLQTLYGVPPNASGCVNQADVNLCDTCNCAPASECNPTSESQWSDGCVHHFVSAAGSILPSTDEPIAACNSS